LAEESEEKAMMRVRTMVLAAATVVGFSMSSCTCQRDQPPLPASDTQTFKERNGGIALKSPTPKQVAAATPTVKQPEVAAAQPTPELPKDFPSDVPVYGDAKVDQVQELPNNAHNVIFKTAGSVSDVTRFYHDKLSKSGWNVTQQFERGNHSFMTYKKGNLIANVTIAEDARTPGQQVIAVMYEEEAPLPFDEF
jgi:hypothetical protein